ncbi:hypothetical protein FBZ84_119106 [Azospirillum baldaniorum]|uniref:hypothetical protein n=1 Tax=Azospirillum baldaniorum TaxID=1064539 RepID=UPI0011A89ED8|nr:hypothetical protein [Azospirillum baldaniorum]TWA58057.1 hypothetical protein FBZ84_119106 [Azospirillum baldaniorum]
MDDPEERELEQRAVHLARKIKRAMDHGTGARLTADEIRLLCIGTLAEWAEHVSSGAIPRT